MNYKLTDITNDVMAAVTISGSVAALKDVVSIVIPILTFFILVIINHRKITEGLSTFYQDYLKRKDDGN